MHFRFTSASYLFTRFLITPVPYSESMDMRMDFGFNTASNNLVLFIELSIISKSDFCTDFFPSVWEVHRQFRNIA